MSHDADGQVLFCRRLMAGVEPLGQQVFTDWQHCLTHLCNYVSSSAFKMFWCIENNCYLFNHLLTQGVIPTSQLLTKGRKF